MARISAATSEESDALGCNPGAKAERRSFDVRPQWANLRNPYIHPCAAGIRRAASLQFLRLAVCCGDGSDRFRGSSPSFHGSEVAALKLGFRYPFGFRAVAGVSAQAEWIVKQFRSPRDRR